MDKHRLVVSEAFSDECEAILDSAGVGSHHALVTMREARTDEVDVAAGRRF
jgi:hypothetical protein